MENLSMSLDLFGARHPRTFSMKPFHLFLRVLHTACGSQLFAFCAQPFHFTKYRGSLIGLYLPQTFLV